MFRATGPGTIRLDRRSSRESHLVWLHLDNFDVDGVALKTEHRDELVRIFRNNMIESGGIIMPVDRIWVFLRGYASRTGGVAHNIDLSRQRVANVRQFLNAYVSDDHITGLQHVGEDWSHSEIEEDENFRSVEVICTTENRSPIPARPPFIYDRFRMRAKLGSAEQMMAAGISMLNLPGGLGATFIQIQINNTTTHAIQDYFFVSTQVTAGLSATDFMHEPPPQAQLLDSSVSDTEYAAWVRFRTRSNHHVALNEFEGSAAFGGLLAAQLGPLSLGENYFSFQSERMHSTAHWVAFFPRTIVLPMPNSFGFGFSLASLSAFGRLIMVS
jgi:hypothetical protein